MKLKWYMKWWFGFIAGLIVFAITNGLFTIFGC